MAAVLSMYSNAILNAFTGGAAGGVDWDTNAIKMALMTAYTFSEDHATMTAAIAAGTQHSAANGYSTGGATLGTKTNTNTGGVITFGSASVVWTATGALTAKYAICYDSVTDTPLFCINLDGAGGDVTATDAAFTITDASGWFSIDVSP